MSVNSNSLKLQLFCLLYDYNLYPKLSISKYTASSFFHHNIMEIVFHYTFELEFILSHLLFTEENSGRDEYFTSPQPKRQCLG